MASRSWGHAIRLIDLAVWPSQSYCSSGKRCPGAHTAKYWITSDWRMTETPIEGQEPRGQYHRGGPARWETTYYYVTGRGGRVSDQRRTLCDACAEKWRAKHPPAVEAADV